MKKKTTTKSCQEIKHSIKRYLMNEMEMKEAEQFVLHVRSCKVCREELEEYYAFSAALMQIDTEEEIEKETEKKTKKKTKKKTEKKTEKGNFFANVEKRLEQTEKQVEKLRSDHIKRRIVYGCIAIALAVAMGVSIGG